jgi:hypothetical protein
MIDGNGVLYHYLQKTLSTEDVWLSRMIAARFIDGLAIWFDPESYQKIPIIRPHVIRCPDCRRPVDEWGSPNEKGYCRDDNSFIKGLPSALNVRSPKQYMNGERIGNGWVASHIWQLNKDRERTTRDPKTNSFIPNLGVATKVVSHHE